MIRRTFLAAILAAMAISPSLADTPTHGILEIASGEARHRFRIEIADDGPERSRGLMFRDYLAPDSGMLFLYPRKQIASFWMKNTFIPLDMLFIADDGTILQIASRTVPHSLEPVRSEAPVRAVFEINGGQAEAMGIAVGDTVTMYRLDPE